VAQLVDTQQLINYEAALQFALGDVLRDLAILMQYSEQGQSPDTTTCTLTLQHLSVFQSRLGALEQDLRAVCTIAQEHHDAIGAIVISSSEQN
jgi:hypothetical protein